jgi:hypothetical protein
MDAPPANVVDEAPRPAFTTPDLSSASPPAEVHENGPSPIYYRLPASSFRVGVRILMGPVFQTARPKAAFGLTVANAMQVVGSNDRPSWVGVVDWGYAYSGFVEHLGLIGFGLYFRTYESTTQKVSNADSFHFALVPHLALGARHAEFAVGARTSMLVGWSVFGIEVTHQMLSAPDGIEHTIHVLAGLNYVFDQELRGPR